MKLVIFSVPNSISREELTEAFVNFSALLGINVRVNILEDKDLLSKPAAKVEDSPYIQALKQIEKVCGDIVRDPSARSEFYSLVINKKIERPILEVLAFGPKNGIELHALKDMGGPEYTKIISTALILNEQLS